MRGWLLVSILSINLAPLALAEQLSRGGGVTERIITNADKDLRIHIAVVRGDGKQTRVSLDVLNAADYEFDRIDLECAAYDGQARAVDRRRTTVTRERYGRLLPGFTVYLPLSFRAPLREVQSVRCEARAQGVPRQAG
jgi:hypothetical protein